MTQISLLAEHELMRLIRLVTAMAEPMKIEAIGALKLSELARDVAPEKVMERMREEEENARPH